GKTVFISSHILSELAELCDSVTIIDRGQIRFSGPMDVLLDNPDGQHSYSLRLADAIENVDQVLANIPGVAALSEPEFTTGRDFILQLHPDVTANEFLAELLKTGLPVASFSQQRKQLNQAFMDLTTRGVRT
ncbi:MAG: ABC transporter ATP-binding protein, partial [Planctomycetota bacterium]